MIFCPPMLTQISNCFCQNCSVMSLNYVETAGILIASPEVPKQAQKLHFTYHFFNSENAEKS